MFALTQRRRRSADIWPGFVDALASVLLVLIFTLLIFVVAQFFLSNQLSGRGLALSQLSRGINDLADQLALEREQSTELNQTIDHLTQRLNVTVAERDALSNRLTLLTQRSQVAESRSAQLQLQIKDLQTTVTTDKEKLRLKLMEIASLQEDIYALRQLRSKLEKNIAGLSSSVQQGEQDLAVVRDRSKALEFRLADEKERTLLAQKIIDKRNIRIRELTAKITNVDLALSEQRELSDQAQSQLDFLNQQIVALREQLAGLSATLELSQTTVKEQKIKITELGQRLNVALARKVEELSRYRSEFFGRLRELLGNHPDVRIQGDRFVFPSELLFSSASAELGAQGETQLAQLAKTLKAVAATIPPDIDWILRIDGHTDKRPIHTAKYSSNWDLSTARALSIVNYLIKQGISPRRLVAAGFGEFHPIDEADTPLAYSRNRRIEIKLTGN
ncbi:MAG: peptidoglycan -binding protein [Gammaproteobacteria bacterium]|nr:peptidoglycan -binding protein [Gammaproteobacteria bacterium]